MNRAIRHHIGIVVFIPFNRPQLGFRLKYFIRLARIGIAYCAEAGGRKAEFGKKMRNTKKQSKSQAERSQLFISTHNKTAFRRDARQFRLCAREDPRLRNSPGSIALRAQAS